MKKKIYLIGNAHIDPVWLWQWQEGYSEVKSTFAAALQRLDEYPDFIFTCSATIYYKWLEDDEPELFSKIKKMIEADRWKIVGGWVIQPDCNMPAGETFARHGLYGQLYYKTRFGKIAKTGYSVDSFGQNANLPQLLKQAGIDNYIYQRPGQHEKSMDKSVFNWISPDGSKIKAARLSFGYTTNTVDQLKERIEQTKLCSDVNETMLFYGIGNHGGGPTIEMLDYIEGIRQKNNADNLEYSDPDNWFDILGKNNVTLEDYKDELQHHASGCYSAHSDIKKKYREAEQELLCAEKFNTVSHLLLNKKAEKEKLTTIWEKLLFNTFHDILCGCSIDVACIDAIEELGGIKQDSKKLANTAVQSISWRIDTVLHHNPVTALKTIGQPIVVFNPHSWEAQIPVRIRTLHRIKADEKNFTAFDSDGNPNLLQITESAHRITRDNPNGDDEDGLFVATVPALGYKLYYIRCVDNIPQLNPVLTNLSLTEVADNHIDETLLIDYGYVQMENKFISVKIDRISGGIRDITEKTSGLNILSAPAGIGIIADDWNNDTWAHQHDYFNDIIGKFRCESLSILENGSVRKVVQTVSTFGKSTLYQKFTLYAHDETVRVDAKIDWQEKHAIAKLVFPVAAADCTNIREIPYASIEKPCTGEEQVSTGWFDVTGKHKDGQIVGITLSSDSKYSFSALGNSMTMTICRSAIYADHGGIRKAHNNYSFLDTGEQSFQYTITPHVGAINPAKAWKTAQECKTNYEIVHESFHKGDLPSQNGYISIEKENIILGAIKIAEQSNDCIIRLFETNGTKTLSKINMPLLNLNTSISFNPYEIKTLKVKNNGDFSECNFLE